MLWTKLVVPLMVAVFFARDLGQGDIQTAIDLIPNEEDDFPKRRSTTRAVVDHMAGRVADTPDVWRRGCRRRGHDVRDC